MSYPEKGATYRNKPAWMDRAVAGEKRAGGGPVQDYSDPDKEPEERTPYDFGPPIDHHGHDQPAYSEGSRGSLMQAIREGGDRSENNKGNGPRKDAVWRGRASGGQVEPLIDSKGRTTDNPGNEFIKNEPPTRLIEPSSPIAAQDAREQAATRTRRTR